MPRSLAESIMEKETPPVVRVDAPTLVEGHCVRCSANGEHDQRTKLCRPCLEMKQKLGSA